MQHESFVKTNKGCYNNILIYFIEISNIVVTSNVFLLHQETFSLHKTKVFKMKRQKTHKGVKWSDTAMVNVWLGLG